MYENVKEKIEEITKICEKVPQEYRAKCFELLIQSLLNENKVSTSQTQSEQVAKQDTVKKPFIKPVQVRAFMSQYEVGEEAIDKIFLLEDENVVPTYTIKAKKASKSQLEVTLLKALENALKGNDFKFSKEDVRTLCDQHKCYDQPNFSANLKKSTNLFNSLEDPESISLSPEGKQALADIILEITA